MNSVNATIWIFVQKSQISIVHDLVRTPSTDTSHSINVIVFPPPHPIQIVCLPYNKNGWRRYLITESNDDATKELFVVLFQYTIFIG